MARDLISNLGMERRFVRLLVAGLALGATSVIAQPASQEGQGPTFRSGVDLVTVSAVVRDGRGRLITDLTRRDFALVDAGRVRDILEFRTEPAPITIALLVDSSGSMGVAGKDADARRVATQLVGALDRMRDEVGLYAFDSGLKELRGFSSARDGVEGLLGDVRPFGLTSLYDAIAETARRAAVRAGGFGHVAVVVLTDGMDTSSALTPSEVSGIASAIDVPIYVVAVTTPLDHPGAKTAVTGAESSPLAGELQNLAHWTGGVAFVSSQPEHVGKAVQQIVNELRHHYLIAFEPDSRPGWHPLELRVRDRHLSVRARGGYFAGQPRTGTDSGRHVP